MKLKESVNNYCNYLGVMDNPLISQSEESFVQAIEPFIDHTVKKRLNVVSKFNDKGRPENIVELVDFPCAIYPRGSKDRRSASSGDRSTTTFAVTVAPPQTLQIGDILIHKTYGMMKIKSLDCGGPWGVVSGEATKLGATDDVVDGDSIRDLPPTKRLF